MSKSSLSKANKYYRERRYREAIEVYRQFVSESGVLRDLVSFNIFLAKKNLGVKDDIEYPVSESQVERLRREAAESQWKGDYWQSVKLWLNILGMVNDNSGYLKDSYQFINYLIGIGAFDQANYFADEALKFFPSNKIYLQKKARVLLKQGFYSDAKDAWRHYWETAKNDDKFSAVHPFKILNGKGCNDKIFEELRRNNIGAERKSAKVCVYTALFGEYDDLPPVLSNAAGVKFICFTDIDKVVPGWEVRVVERTEENPFLENRKYKMLPHKFLKEYEYSCYVDSNILIASDFSHLINYWLVGNNFVAWRHPDRNDVYSEIEAIISNLRHAPEAMLQQHEYFKEQGMPSNTGMIEACFLWRSHEDLKVKNLMEKWWAFVKDNGNRDQPALAYLMWKESICPKVLPNIFGDTRKNDFFVKQKHQKNPLQSQSKNNILNGKRPLGHLGNNKPFFAQKKIIWVYAKEAQHVASTVMRGKQLSNIAKNRLRNFEVGYVNEDSLGTIRNTIVILTKGFLKKVSAAQISVLKKNNNIICVDYVDDPENESVVNQVDVLIASSIGQILHYKNKYPNKLSHIITHHVDPDLTTVDVPKKKLRIGYFGELANARWRDKLSGHVEFVLTNTKVRGREWISELDRFNCHYAVREKRNIDGFKPFLKGFTAAACGANILVPKIESDSRFYLTSDYPYLIKDDSYKNVLEGLEYLEESFGSKEWFEGLEIMKSVANRSSDHAISEEIRSLVDLVI